MRLILASNENGDIEIVIFTEDELSPVDDLLPPQVEVHYDHVIDIDCLLPGSFPLDYVLYRGSPI